MREQSDLAERLRSALEKLTKWRTVFAGWQLGTRTSDDPESQAVRDHREVTMLMRVELNAVAKLLLDKGVITVAEWQAAVLEEALALDKSFEERFPGFESTEYGMAIDVVRSRQTTRGWRP